MLNQAVGSVRDEEDQVHIEIIDRGNVPMPVYLQVVLEDGTTLEEMIPVDVWLQGQRTVEVTLETGQPVTDVIIDPDHMFPDIDRSASRWHR